MGRPGGGEVAGLGARPAEGTGGPGGDCENCARPADDLAVVRRVWVLPEPTVADDTEWWCLSCRSQYPHEPV